MNKIYIILFLCCLSWSAWAANVDKTIRSYDHAVHPQANDSYLIQRNKSGPYFYTSYSDLQRDLLNSLVISGENYISASSEGFTVKPVNLSGSNVTGVLKAAGFPALTGDLITSAGALTTILSTVNSNIGTWGSSTAIPNFTVNNKGLVTAAGTSAVIAPAGTLTGTTLASGVVTSSITTLGSDASLPGNPTSTTQTTGNSSTRVATTAFAGAAVKADTRCYDFYFTTPGGSVEPTGSNPPPAFKDFPFAFTISQIYLSVYTAGAGNAIVNGGFGTDSIWTKGTGVTIDTVNNWAAFSAVTGVGLTQTPAHALTPSWSYVVTYTVSGYSAGSIFITVGGTNGTTRSANGTYTETITTSADPTIIFTGTGFTGNISAVSATSYATFDIQSNGVSILDASRLKIDNSTTDSRNNLVNPQPTIVLPTVLSKNTISVVVIKDDDQNAMAGGDMVICGSKP